MKLMKALIGYAPIMKAFKRLHSKGCARLKSIRLLHKKTVNQANRTNQKTLMRLTKPTQKTNKKMKDKQSMKIEAHLMQQDFFKLIQQKRAIVMVMKIPRRVRLYTLI